MNAIECYALTRHFGKVCALYRLTLQVPAGSVFALLGSNGAGKTTLLKLILNLLRPTSGQARVLGGNSANLRADTFQRIGYVAEDLIQPDWMELSAFLGYHRSLYRSWDPALESHLRAKFALPEGIAIQRFSRGPLHSSLLVCPLPGAAFRGPDFTCYQQNTTDQRAYPDYHGKQSRPQRIADTDVWQSQIHDQVDDA